MKFNEENLSNFNLDEEIDNLSKKLYLESPDLWIEFSDKMNDKKFDEMVLFFATKYNYFNMIKYAVENKLINLDSPSKNVAYPSIRDHLILVAKQNNNNDIYNYLNNTESFYVPSESVSLKIDSSNLELNTNKNIINKDSNIYIPKFICPNCSINIFNLGYKVTKEIEYKYSPQESKIINTSDKVLDSIICCNCNNVVPDATPSILENLCTIQRCSKCGLDLTSVGIIDKSKMYYDKDLNKFTSQSVSYHCANCDNCISQNQKNYFKF